MVRSDKRSSINTRPRQMNLPSSGMSSDVQSALTRLEAKLKAMPPSVLEERERRYHELQAALRRGRRQ